MSELILNSYTFSSLCIHWEKQDIIGGRLRAFQGRLLYMIANLMKVNMTNIDENINLLVIKKATRLHNFRQSFRFYIQILFSPVVCRGLFRNVFYRNH